MFTFWFLFLLLESFGFWRCFIFAGFTRVCEIGSRYVNFLAILGGVSLKITLPSASIDS